MATDLISIGYEGLTIDALIARLRIHGAVALADVRLNAISRKQGFSKKALSASLADAGIEYVHLPELGNHRDNRTGYAEPGTEQGNAARATFSEALATSKAQDGLHRIRQLAGTGPVAVFCYEANENHCHREQVLGAIRSPALTLS